jgi:hypothetical protein
MLVDGVSGFSAGAPPVLLSPLQALDPSVVIEAPPTARAVVAFGLTILFGGAMFYREGRRVSLAVASSRERPLVSVLYGLIAFAIVSFFTAYLLSQLFRLGLNVTLVGLIAALVVGGVLLTLGGLGFAVVGAWANDIFGLGDPWLGLVGVAAVSGLVWLALPFVLSILLWLGIAAVGIGGPTKHWLHSTRPQPAD